MAALRLMEQQQSLAESEASSLRRALAEVEDSAQETQRALAEQRVAGEEARDAAECRLAALRTEVAEAQAQQKAATLEAMERLEGLRRDNEAAAGQLELRLQSLGNEKASP